MFKSALFLLSLLAGASATGQGNGVIIGGSNGNGNSGSSSTLTMRITNLSGAMLFAPVFIMVHDEDVEPIWTFGQAASTELSTLSETGNPQPLVDSYSGREGVISVTSVVPPNVDIFPGETFTTSVTVPSGAVLSIAATNFPSNDR